MVNSAPDLAAMETAEAIAHRHGLVVRPRPGLGFDPEDAVGLNRARILRTFDHIALAGPGRQTLVVAPAIALGIMIRRCTGETPTSGDLQDPEPASLTEVLVEGRSCHLVRVADHSHLGALGRSG